MPKIDLSSVEILKGTSYPPQFSGECQSRTRMKVGNIGGLSDFGVNLTVLPPLCWSSQRHWHTHEDELIYIIEGEVILVEDEGETNLKAGDFASFPKNSGNGHHLKNTSDNAVIYLEIGSRNRDDITYCSDIDLKSANLDGKFVKYDGTPY